MSENKKVLSNGITILILGAIVFFSVFKDDGYDVPKAQSEFTNVINEHRDLYKSASSSDNDLKKEASRFDRRLALRDTMNGYSVNKWIGEIGNIGSVNDGEKASFSVLIDDDIELKTWNNRFSDLGSSTLIESGSTLYDKVFDMESGQTVIFSGTFLPDDDDYISESSLTLRGSMERPEFIFKFSDISHY